MKQLKQLAIYFVEKLERELWGQKIFYSKTPVNYE
jgi:hypothetical protein